MAEHRDLPATLESESPATRPDDAASIKQALRIQAAAVVAQQAALMEEELRLEQRSQAFEQQEKQLGAHLEEQRRGLEALRTEVRHSQQSLRHCQAAFEERVSLALQKIACERRELDQGRQAIQAERRRLMDLRRRMIARWHRHWAGERLALEKTQTELGKARRDSDKTTRRLQKEQEALTRAWQRANGKLEQKRKELAESKAVLRTQQQNCSALARSLAEREALLEAGHRQLAVEKGKWEGQRSQLLAEIEGLEARARHIRAKHRDEQAGRQDREVLALKQPKPDPTIRSDHDGSGSSELETQSDQAGPSQGDIAPDSSRQTELEHLAGQLADQRLVLMEECSRLTTVQLQWQQRQQAIVAELETLAQGFDQRESALVGHEEEFTRRDREQSEQRRGLERAYNELQALQARLASQTSAWEAEKDRHLAAIAQQERHREEQFQAADELRRRWEERRERQVKRLRSQLHEYGRLRQELSGVRNEFFRRRTALVQEQRQVAERTLALEQLRQEYLARAEDPAAAERRLNILLQQWSEEAGSIEAALSKERRAIEKELSRIDERLAELQTYHVELAERETALTRQEASWEKRQAAQQSEQERQHRDLAILRAQRESYEQEIQKLREEVDKLANLLLNQSLPTPLSANQAA